MPREGLECSTRLSHSCIWDALRRFYDTQGVYAWNNGIVSSVSTSTAVVAYKYASHILELLRHDPSPLYIVEIGAGHGELSYLVLSFLYDNMSYCSGAKFKYVLTDLCEANVEFCRKHPSLQKFVADCTLEFAQYDVENSDQLVLEEDTLSFYNGKGINMVVIANCLFSSLRHDVFRKGDGGVYEGLLTVKADSSIERIDPGMFPSTSLVFDWSPVSIDGYYSGRYADLNETLLEYFAAIDEGVVYVPLGAINCIKRLVRFGCDRLIILESDIATNTLTEALFSTSPKVTINGGCCAIPVNNILLSNYTKQYNGQTISSCNFEGFKIAQFSFGKFSPDLELSFTQLFIDSCVQDCTILQSYCDRKTPIPLMLAIIRYCQFDPNVLYMFRVSLIEHLGFPWLDLKLRHDLLRCIERSLKLYYPLSVKKDLYFEVGRMYMALGEYNQARLLFTKSLEFAGNQVITLCNLELATCSRNLEDMDSAIRFFKTVLTLDSSNTFAKQGLDEFSK